MIWSEHLGAAHVLDPVGKRLEVAVVGEVRLEGVLRRVGGGVQGRPELLQAPHDLVLVVVQPVLELVVARGVGVRQLDPHHPVLGRRAVQRVARRVRTAVLHRLQHPGHL
jgi:hypothetical protein